MNHEQPPQIETHPVVDEPAPPGARLVAEVQAMARLSHRNVVGVHEISFAEGAAFLVMNEVTDRTR